MRPGKARSERKKRSFLGEGGLDGYDDIDWVYSINLFMYMFVLFVGCLRFWQRMCCVKNRL